MNTPAHLLLGLAVFGRREHPRVSAAALAGALLPDLSLYLLAGGSLAIGIPAGRVFGELYFSDLWQMIFAIDNSVPIWGLLLAMGIWAKRLWIVALAGAGLLHLALDLPLHHDDGRPHIWPLSDWVFASPLSYWDRAHHAGWVAPIETALALVAAAWSWVRFPSAWIRVTVLLLAAAQLSVGGLWRYLF
ncbi:cobalamin biosynthesis protein CobQ [Jannaschia formosa]|uniref:cobalamin biosynthesis protein CobQ n=1 Tax=Jannaschia formosa TaxID=2259592 RepID=UPI000E1BD6D0|nr:cobalamin biosynthesis protein CobQ [Jannaschia formosa]TFL16468.1 cobalamin biosynthesis protein CobQ [Jannaschia formosa]